MPAVMDDPTSAPMYPPCQNPNHPGLPASVAPRQVTLRDRQTVATVLPFASRDQVPASLLKYLSDQFAKEIEGGDTYPMIEPMPLDQYSKYWFQNFAAIMLLGSISSLEEVVEGKDWSKECLGSFYIKPNYPGRSSHVCNAGFLVTDASRNRGVGRLMGESYLDYAPKLGYVYSVFNLVYETNVASCRIWDALGFKRIGRVKGCGKLESYPDRLVDAIIYGRDLGDTAEGAEGPVSEERFDKIKFYLKYARYPDGSDRAEKSRLRSAATHYKLLDNDILMLKGKEVISDPIRQIEISKRVHEAGSHAGINKTTATIAEQYHWSRIKETVSDVIRFCGQCKDLGKMPVRDMASARSRVVSGSSNSGTSFKSAPSMLSPATATGSGSVDSTSRILGLQAHSEMSSLGATSNPYNNPSDISSLLNPAHPLPPEDPNLQAHGPMFQDQHHGQLNQVHHHVHRGTSSPLSPLHDDAAMYHPIDPQIISQPSHQQNHQPFNAFHAHNVPSHTSPHPSHSSLPGHESYDSHMQSHHQHAQDQDSFQALLNDGVSMDHDDGRHQQGSMDAQDEPPEDQDAVDRDMDMLIEHGNEFEEEVNLGGVEASDRENDGGGSSDTKDEYSRTDYERPSKRRNWDTVVFDAS